MYVRALGGMCVHTFLRNAITRANLKRFKKFQLWVVDLAQAQTSIGFDDNRKWFKAAVVNMGTNYRKEAS